MMLSENMEESTKGVIKIEDYPACEFLYFMLFIYCDNMLLDTEKALNLLKVFNLI